VADPIMVEAMNLLEAEPACKTHLLTPNIPALREELTILVSTGKAKEDIGIKPTQ